MSRHVVILLACFSIVLVGGCRPLESKEESSGKNSARTSDKAANIRYHAGYQSSRLVYKNGNKQRISRRLSIWYPAKENPGTLDYRKISKGIIKPADIASGKFPVVLFSHGLWSAPEFSSFLHEELSRRGYIVAGVHHKDALTEWSNHKPKMPKFFKPKQWNATTHADRGEDVRALLDHLLAENGSRNSFLQGHIAKDSIGAMGHSMGGHTICGLIGGWASWHEPRVRAALLLSPYIMPYLPKGRADRIRVPVMLQGATGDLGITPFLPALYKQLPQPKYFLVLDRENHFSWTNLVCRGRPSHQAVNQGSPELIVRYSAAFFDRHLKGLRQADQTLRKESAELKKYVFD